MPTPAVHPDFALSDEQRALIASTRSRMAAALSAELVNTSRLRSLRASLNRYAGTNDCELFRSFWADWQFAIEAELRMHERAAAARKAAA